MAARTVAASLVIPYAMEATKLELASVIHVSSSASTFLQIMA